tara:strand:- start:36 stop:485 length:450 start_codon:yes stop_codon:yes gene_type:complete
MAANLTAYGPSGGVAFQAQQSSNQLNLGAGTTAIALGTEIFDLGGNFASSTFTAPVTGKYQLNYQIRLQNVDSANPYVYPRISTSNRDYENIWTTSKFSADMDYMCLGVYIVADMDASDTAVAQVNIQGGTAQTDTEQTSCYFSGFLIG